MIVNEQYIYSGFAAMQRWETFSGDVQSMGLPGLGFHLFRKSRRIGHWQDQVKL